MPALMIIIPLVGLLALNLPLGQFFKRMAYGFAASICLLQILFVINPPIPGFWRDSDLIQSILLFRPQLDHISFVVFLSIAIVALVALSTARAFMRDEVKQFNFVNLVILSLIGMNGLVLSTDLFSLYVFLEIISVASFVMIALDKGRNALEGAFKYIVLSAIATVLMLASVSIVLLMVGSLSFQDISLAAKTTADQSMLLVAAGLFVSGLFIKSGAVPFHGWLPDAYSSAPAPVSILLAGIVTKAGGVYTLIRVVYSVFGFSPTMNFVLLVVGMISIVVGALAALAQRDFKRMLAYSSISQVGYIILGLGAGSVLGIAGAVLHFFNHSIFKTLLFVNAAAVEKETGTRDMNELGGIAARMPITGTTSVIGFLSTAGIPPLSGFWSKLIIIIAVWKAGYHSYAVVGILASLLTLAYFLSMQRRVFFGKLAVGYEDLQEASPAIVIPAIVLAAITVILGLTLPWIFDTFLLPIRSIL